MIFQAITFLLNWAPETFDLKRDLPLYLSVLRGACAYHAVVVLVFATTLAVYPAVTVLVEPSGSESTPWNDVYFVPVCCFVLFNFGDYFGKQLATIVKRPGPSRSGQALLLLLTALRIALVPLLMYCNVSPLDRQTEVRGEKTERSNRMVYVTQILP